MAKGRKALPEGEKMVSMSVRLPQWMVHAARQQGNLSAVIRKALENYFEPPLL